MKGFRIVGSFRDTRNMQNFSVEIAGEDEAAARERALSTLGSRHKLKRWEITIDSVTELKPEEVTDALVQYQIG